MLGDIDLSGKYDYPQGKQNRPYEYDPVIPESAAQGRRDGINAYYGLNTGRDFSQDKAENFGLTIRQIAGLQHLRFMINEAPIIGRDIMLQKIEISRDTLKSAIAYALSIKPKIESPIEITEGDYTIKVWYSKQAKRTWRGNDITLTGEVPEREAKAFYTNQGKRNRRMKGW